MQRLALWTSLAVALAAPHAAAAAAPSCSGPGTCELHYSGGRWAHVPQGHAIDLSRQGGADSADRANPIVIDGSRDRDDAVIDGTSATSVNRVIDAVMWNRTTVGSNEVWTRAPRTQPASR